MVELIKFTITAIKQETADCKTFYLQPDRPVTYKAGQFLPFVFSKNGHEIRRSYSFSSSPDMDDFISVTVKRTANGEMSRWWIDKAQVGMELTSLLPAGRFTIEWLQQPRDIFLAAAGAGITPIYSLLKSALLHEPQSNIHLIYSNSNLDKAIFFESLESLARKYSRNLTITWLFSDAAHIFKARLGTFNLENIINHTLQFDKANALVYTCGPFNYMQMVQITSRSMGIPDNHIRRELFDINEVVNDTKKYFDTKNRTIKIKVANQEYIINIPYNKSILQAALEKNIELPYNCRAGRCSTCICHVKQGKIWMHHNEVLTDQDIERGLALTCTGHPASDDLIIEI